MRLLLADDHPLFLDAVSLQVERSLPGTEVFTARSLDEALEVGRTALPLDIVLLDLFMPGMDGIHGVARAREAFGAVPIVIMSGLARPEEVVASIQAGARGFLPKTLTGAVFASALRVVLDGGTYLPVEMLTAAPAGGGTAAAPPADDGLLTPRELEVLKGVVEGMSNKEIARALDVQEVTVKLHARRIFQKLGVRNRAEAAAVAVERHLIAPVPSEPDPDTRRAPSV